MQQQRTPTRPTNPRAPSYGRHVSEQSPYFEPALQSFADWLSARKPDHEQFSIRRTGVTSDDMEDMVKEWITRMTSPNGETLNQELEGPNLPVYIVDCPKLHVVPKKRLEYKLRWCDKWAYEVRLYQRTECR